MQDWVTLLSCFRLAFLFFPCGCITVFILPFYFLYFFVFNDLLLHLVTLKCIGCPCLACGRSTPSTCITLRTFPSQHGNGLFFNGLRKTCLNSMEVNLILRLLSRWRSAANSERWIPLSGTGPSFHYFAFVPARGFGGDCALTRADKTAKPWKWVCAVLRGKQNPEITFHREPDPLFISVRRACPARFLHLWEDVRWGLKVI